MNWNADLELFDAAFKSLTEDDDVVADGAAGDDDDYEISPELNARLRRLLSRSGIIDGLHCVIEELKGGVFVLHGFRDGQWEIIGKGPSVDRESDAIASPTTAKFTLVPVDQRDDAAVGPEHLILEMQSQDADEFFDDICGYRWEAREIEGQERVAVINDSGVQIQYTPSF